MRNSLVCGWIVLIAGISLLKIQGQFWLKPLYVFYANRPINGTAMNDNLFDIYLPIHCRSASANG